MKKSGEINDRFVKQVFTEANNDLQKYSKCQLGEDFYSLNKGDKEINLNYDSKALILNGLD